MTGRIPEQIIQEIKNRLSIREVVSDYVTLTRDGANQKGLCPFHKEKTPSFKVHDGMGIFRCFGCGESGNIFTFLMKIEGITFYEAVRRLASRAGVDIPEKERTREEKDEDKRRNRIFAANEIAEAFYIDMLWNSREGRRTRAYLESRKISREWAEKFHLGYSPDSWEGLLQHLKQKGLSEEVIHEAGLAIKRDTGGYYDRFRNRLMFPIRDIAGRVRGFGGRKLDDTDEESPKYINSPDTPAYKKGQSFYGIDMAKDEIRKADRVIIVEGYFDRIRLAMAGIGYALASLGTAFTSEQALMVRRYTRNVFTVFDTDSAGLKASLRALEVFLDEGVTPRIVLLTSGKDPDDFVETEGGEAFLGLIENAPSLVDFFIDQELDKGSGTPGEIAHAVQRMAPVLSKIRDNIERSLYVKKLSERLGVPHMDIQRRLSRPVRKDDEKQIPAEGATIDDQYFAKEEEELLALLLHHPEVAGCIIREDALSDFSSPELAGFMARLLDQVKRTGFADPGLIIHETNDFRLSDLVSRLALDTDRYGKECVDTVMNDCLRRLRIGHIFNEKARLQREILEAERNQQHNRLKELLLEKSRLLKREQDLRTAGTQT